MLLAGPAIRDVHFHNRPLQLLLLSSNNEGKQSAIVTLGVVVVLSCA